ncbi:MAG: tetratricopeptide repeat protein, partial [Bacteroidota bacterium]
MKHMKFIFFLLGCSLFLMTGHAQTSLQKKPAAQQKVVRINPVKVDTTDPNKKALNKFSKEQMFNVNAAPKQLKPDEIKALNFFNDGSKKGKAGDFEGAIQDFTRSLDLNKGVATYVKRGNAYLMLGNYGAAINDATEALKLQGSFTMAYFVRGIARFETGDYKGSKEDFDFFLDKDRSNAIAFNYMAA